jgi:hypothetical protein
MIGRMLRVLIGLGLACLASGLTISAFVYSPLELIHGGGDKAAEAGLLALTAAGLSARAALFALIALAILEWRRLGSWFIYAPAGVAVGGLGFLAQCAEEAGGRACLADAYYALQAFLAAGLVAGSVYWLFAGRFAPTRRRAARRPEVGRRADQSERLA